MELEMIDMKKIHANPLQPRQEFDREKLQELANSIREAELLQPIVVREDAGEYEIVAGERRFKAFQILKEPKIPGIVRKFKDDTDVLEKSLIENWQRDDLTSAEKERALRSLWESKQYPSYESIAKKLGLACQTIEYILGVEKDRRGLNISDKISTRTISDTKGLSDGPRKKILKQIEEKKISTDNVRAVVRKVKEFPEPEQQLEILDEFEKHEDFSKDALNIIVEEKKRIADGVREPEWQPPKEENRWFLDDMQRDFDKIYSYGVGNLDGLPKIQRDEAVEVLANALIYLMSQMVKMNEVERVRSIYEEKVNI